MVMGFKINNKSPPRVKSGVGITIFKNKQVNKSKIRTL